MQQISSLKNIDLSDQSVRDLVAEIFQALSDQEKEQQNPKIQLEIFGAVLEVKLIKFG